MKERPIIFSGPMVRAILEGRKTQTRRVVIGATGKWEAGQCGVLDPGPVHWNIGGRAYKCPYGQSGDRLWVKETYSLTQHGKPVYRADGKDINGVKWGIEPGDPSRECLWKSPLFMPRWASRITLELVNVRVERVQDISEEDAKAEGVQKASICDDAQCDDDFGPMNYADGYQIVWESIHGQGSWAANPWVWVLEFKRLQA